MRKHFLMIFCLIVFLPACMSTTQNRAKENFSEIKFTDSVVPLLSSPELIWFVENVYYGMPVTDLSNDAFGLNDECYIALLQKNEWVIFVAVNSEYQVSNMFFLDVKNLKCYKSILFTKTETLLNKITEGMTEQEVINIMGSPDSIEKISDSGEEVIYSLIYKATSPYLNDFMVGIDISETTGRVVKKWSRHVLISE